MNWILSMLDFHEISFLNILLQPMKKSLFLFFQLIKNRYSLFLEIFWNLFNLSPFLLLYILFCWICIHWSKKNKKMDYFKKKITFKVEMCIYMGGLIVLLFFFFKIDFFGTLKNFKKKNIKKTLKNVEKVLFVFWVSKGWISRFSKKIQIRWI